MLPKHCCQPNVANTFVFTTKAFILRIYPKILATCCLEIVTKQMLLVHCVDDNINDKDVCCLPNVVNQYHRMFCMKF